MYCWSYRYDGSAVWRILASKGYVNLIGKTVQLDLTNVAV